MRSDCPLTSFFDRAFDNEMNTLIEETAMHYDATNYKSALKSGLFDFQNARNWYRDVTGGNMHRDLILRFIKAQARLIAPIAPHWSEYVWHDILKNVTLPQTESANGSLVPFKMLSSPRRCLLRIKRSLQLKSISRVLPIPSIKPRAFNFARRQRANKVNLTRGSRNVLPFTSQLNFPHGNKNTLMSSSNSTMRYTPNSELKVI
jgi:hypothetical protein